MSGFFVFQPFFLLFKMSWCTINISLLSFCTEKKTIELGAFVLFSFWLRLTLSLVYLSFNVDFAWSLPFLEKPTNYHKLHRFTLFIQCIFKFKFQNTKFFKHSIISNRKFMNAVYYLRLSLYPIGLLASTSYLRECSIKFYQKKN